MGNKWISVKDKLPKTSDDVLFYTNYMQIGFCIEGSWHNYEDESKLKSSEVCCWMYLSYPDAKIINKKNT